LNSQIELKETSLEMESLSFGVAQIDGILLALVLLTLELIKMEVENIAELAELGLSVEFDAEIESLTSDFVVETLSSGIVAEEIQALTVGLPKKFDPWNKNDTIFAVLISFGRDCRHKNVLRRLSILEIVDVFDVSLRKFFSFLGLLFGH